MIAFMDTFALIAWLSSTDGAHGIVRNYLGGYRGRLLTTEWVLMEVADALSRPPARRIATEFLWAVRSDPAYEIISYRGDAYEAGFRLYVDYTDKEWSLTDCISIAAMKQRGLTDALTEDRHFAQAGLRAIFEDYAHAAR